MPAEAPSAILPHASVAAGQLNFAEVLAGISMMPSVLTLLQDSRREIAALREQVAKAATPSSVGAADGWLDAKGAAKYLSLSPGSFDKYRYNTNPKLKGYRLDGKTLYKRSDLDSFVRLYELKSTGLA